MNYEGNIIRPPSEANSIILQVTVGCSHNKCTFCGAYKGTRFRIKDDAVIDEDLAFAARYCRRLQRVFLADGDAMIMPQSKLVGLLGRIRSTLPWVNRISLYANARSIRRKSLDELVELRELGLDRIYMGLESGHDPTLAAINKGADSRKMIEAGCRVRDAGMYLSVTVLLGIGGCANSLAHAEATGRVLTAMHPKQIAVLTLMLLPDTALYRDFVDGRFQMPDSGGLLVELKAMLLHIDLDRVQFQANHASNYLPISGRLARDKERVLAQIDQAIAGKTGLVPEYLRAL